MDLGKVLFPVADEEFIRTANLEQAIVEFEDNIGIFYYKGVKDENWNGVIDDGEEFYRKGTIELLPDGVKITIELSAKKTPLRIFRH